MQSLYAHAVRLTLSHDSVHFYFIFIQLLFHLAERVHVLKESYVNSIYSHQPAV